MLSFAYEVPMQVPFDNLPNGTIFKTDMGDAPGDFVYIKIPVIHRAEGPGGDYLEDLNAFCLDSCRYMHFDDGSLVIPFSNSKIVLA